LNGKMKCLFDICDRIAIRNSEFCGAHDIAERKKAMGFDSLPFDEELGNSLTAEKHGVYDAKLQAMRQKRRDDQDKKIGEAKVHADHSSKQPLPKAPEPDEFTRQKHPWRRGDTEELYVSKAERQDMPVAEQAVMKRGGMTEKVNRHEADVLPSKHFVSSLSNAEVTHLDESIDIGLLGSIRGNLPRGATLAEPSEDAKHQAKRDGRAVLQTGGGASQRMDGSKSSAVKHSASTAKAASAKAPPRKKADAVPAAKKADAVPAAKKADAVPAAKKADAVPAAKKSVQIVAPESKSMRNDGTNNPLQLLVSERGALSTLLTR